MAKLGLPVPPGFTISTKVCEDFYKNNKKLPKKIFQQVKKEIKIIEKISKKKFGDLSNPLLVSVRSGSKISISAEIKINDLDVTHRIDGSLVAPE